MKLTQTSTGAFAHPSFETAIMVYPGQMDMHPLPGFEDWEGAVISDLELFLFMFRVGATFQWAIDMFMPPYAKYWGQIRSKYPKAKEFWQYGMPYCEESILAVTDQVQFNKLAYDWGQKVLQPVINCGLTGVAPSCYYNGKPNDAARVAAQCKIAVSAREQMKDAGGLVWPSIHAATWPRLNGPADAPMLTTETFLANEIANTKDTGIDGILVWGVEGLYISEVVDGSADAATRGRIQAEVYAPLNITPTWPAEKRFLESTMGRQWLEKLDAVVAATGGGA